MNQRIKELEAQCWEPRQYGPAWFNSTKFAELIVKECAKVAFYDWYDGTNEGSSKMAILKHFGVTND